ncbi:MAG: N-acetylmuramoyl-L-alanine amidase [Aestuariivita sp.]|nr:N-acetylmuramoyl-L-alanine amidase [Aestuariivita sp.]MCY4346792.1 N-acetylmuramoyl-L-alanine amidase [Aestuariivita sp.]
MIWHPSPNFGSRRHDALPTLVVIHYTAMSDVYSALERLCDPSSKVSAHYLIGRDGSTWQLVDEGSRAWHAGSGSWKGIDDVNSHSIGIELDNDGIEAFSELQMERLEELLPIILERWGIPAAGVIAHSDCAPSRKWDPGPKFDWLRLAHQGLAAQTPYPSDQIISENLATLLHNAGYTEKANQDDVLAAFRLRHRQGFIGPPDQLDKSILAALCD